ncbi:DUF2280 domain-containing protein [Pseudomonas syringae pv. pisi str. PP1]|nr:DUF2280 domain-containing protein [Pseudomonas syringae pv. pisi str. PP1]
MAALRDEVKAFIVQALACFDAPSQVVLAVKEHYGIDVSRQLCERYDPNKYAGRDLSQKWKTYFHECRSRFREETADIDIANRAYRLRGLSRVAQKAETMRNSFHRQKRSLNDRPQIHAGSHFDHPCRRPGEFLRPTSRGV